MMFPWDNKFSEIVVYECGHFNYQGDCVGGAALKQIGYLCRTVAVGDQITSMKKQIELSRKKPATDAFSQRAIDEANRYMQEVVDANAREILLEFAAAMNS